MRHLTAVTQIQEDDHANVPQVQIRQNRIVHLRVARGLVELNIVNDVAQRHDDNGTD
jgi:hypothetical protein